MFSGLESPTHLLIVLVIILLLFGAKRLPEMGRNLGQSIREFKEGLGGKEVPEKRSPEAVEKANAGTTQESKEAGHTKGSE